MYTGNGRLWNSKRTGAAMKVRRYILCGSAYTRRIEDAERRLKRGERQSQCPTCKRWFWADKGGRVKIKVRGRVYDANAEPIMVILTDQDKKNIANMAPDAKMYAAVPDGYFESTDAFLAWMDEGEEPK